MPPITFPSLRCRFALLASALLLLICLLPQPADARPAVKVKTYSAAVKKGKLVSYRIKGIHPRTIRGARLRASARRQQALPLRAVRSAAARGVLKVRLRAKLAKKPATGVVSAPVAPTLVLKIEDRRVELEPTTSPTETIVAAKKKTKPAPTSPTPTDPAPAPEPAPAPAPSTPLGGDCPAYGTFGMGIVPGACWRPYSDASPFNRRIPATAPLLSNSQQIVDRITSFGPAQHIRGKVAGTDKDAGDPVYWSQPTDPQFTIHCLERWGTCAIEGHVIRIPVQAQPAGDSDGHMTVIDQSTGWEYDFWTVRPRDPSGGRIDIGWGGRTRIDGDGLGSDATAGKYGNLAGKLRIEELQAGRIDHALFLVAKCSSGGTVYPAGSNPGRSCSDIGEPNLNAPPMGARVQLDMTAAEIDALNVPKWRKTIFHAMAEYGMIMGDTGGAWGIAEESGLSHTAWGQPDPWVTYAEQNGVPYYAPDDVFVYNIRDGVDWRSRLRVVDPCVSRGTC